MLARVLTGTGAGFVASYAVWQYQRLGGETKLPHTVRNPDWAAATLKMNAAKERVAAGPIALNPRNVLG